jgi:hypothetical protein
MKCGAFHSSTQALSAIRLEAGRSHWEGPRMSQAVDQSSHRNKTR